MSFEEQLEQLIAADRRIQERHEALAQTVESLEHAQQRTDAAVRRTDAAVRRTDAALRRAIRLSVREARAERERRRVALAEIDDKITKLASAQIVTEEKLQRFLDASRGTNGHRSE